MGGHLSTEYPKRTIVNDEMCWPPICGQNEWEFDDKLNEDLEYDLVYSKIDGTVIEGESNESSAIAMGLFLSRDSLNIGPAYGHLKDLNSYLNRGSSSSCSISSSSTGTPSHRRKRSISMGSDDISEEYGWFEDFESPASAEWGGMRRSNSTRYFLKKV